MTSATPNDPRAVGTAVACYTLWGLLPLLFMAMAAAGFGAPEILVELAAGKGGDGHGILPR